MEKEKKEDEVNKRVKEAKEMFLKKGDAEREKILKLIKEQKKYIVRRIPFIIGQFLYLCVFFQTKNIYYFIFSPVAIVAMITASIGLMKHVLITKMAFLKLVNGYELNSEEIITFIIAILQIILMLAYALRIPYFKKSGFSILIIYFIVQSIIDFSQVHVDLIKQIYYFTWNKCELIKGDMIIRKLKNPKTEKETVIRLLNML